MSPKRQSTNNEKLRNLGTSIFRNETMHLVAIFGCHMEYLKAVNLKHKTYTISPSYLNMYC